jgi:hypothetical protein
MSEREQEERDKRLAKIAVREFLDQIYANVGRSLLEKLLYVLIGAVITLAFSGHVPFSR